MNGLALCAGGGGLELGLSLALGGAYRPICYVEREIFASSGLVSKMEEGRLYQAPVWDDLTTFDGRRWRGCTDLISVGFPCQPFSAAGKRQADTDDRHLWPHVRRVINGTRAPLVFLENVSALVSTRQRDGRPAYMVVRNELERLGYRVAETLVRASDVGAPHRRERLFILGVADAPVADACDDGRGISGTPQHDDRRDARGDILNRCHAAVADAERLSSTGRGDGRGLGRTPSTGQADGPERERNGRAVDGRIGAFPPGPGDTDAWHAILAERPELAPALEPAVRGMADGVARAMEHRTQRLRLLGNGVIPAQAADAFVKLLDEMGT